MRLPITLIALLAFAAAQPGNAQPASTTAPAADDGPYSCLFADLTGERRALASPAASTRLTDMPEGVDQQSEAALDAILARIAGCGDAGGWTAGQRGMAEHYVHAQLAREYFRRHYAAQRVDLGLLDEAAAIPPGNPMPEFDALVARLRAQGVADDRPDSAGDIAYLYLSLARHAEEMKAGFAVPGLASPN
ncbi:MAG TPA: hypothetical protein VLK25_08460 [Allosphingosinicella sp.]|nr:hypothetical protein [Allosphingosinicella sp.]